MENIKSFYIGQSNASGMVFKDKYSFLEALSEEIDRWDEEGKHEHFDVTIEDGE